MYIDEFDFMNSFRVGDAFGFGFGNWFGEGNGYGTNFGFFGDGFGEGFGIQYIRDNLNIKVFNFLKYRI